MGRSTGSDAWATLGGLALGLAVSGGLRWGSRHARTRAILIPLGLNLAALAFLAAVLVSGGEAGAMAGHWSGWLWPAGAALLAGVAVFRFPRSVGLPVLALAGGIAWFTAGALKEFALVDPLQPPTMTVQPLTDREVVTSFSWRADFVSPPADVPIPSFTLCRFRAGNATPPEWWWSWAATTRWAWSVGVAGPVAPLKFGVYRLALNGKRPVWTLFKPELTPPP